MATTTAQKPRIPLIAWVGLVLIPLTLITPWMWVLVAPVLIVGAIMTFGSWGAMRPALKEKGSGPTHPIVRDSGNP